MTFKQLEKIKSVLLELDALRKAPNAKALAHIDENLVYFLGQDYKRPSLQVRLDLVYNNESKTSDMLDDIDKIQSTLEGMIAQNANYSLVNEILDVIKEGENIGEDYNSRQQFIARVYYSYSNCIQMEPSLIAIANEAIVRKSSLDIDFEDEKTIDNVVILGLIGKLRQYAEYMIQEHKIKGTKNDGAPTIVVNNVANASSNINMDISVKIENAIKQIEEACLSDEQEKDVLAKIQELKEIVESKDSKQRKWAKIKDFFKWVAEQGIQVASIIVPLLAGAIK